MDSACDESEFYCLCDACGKRIIVGEHFVASTIGEYVVESADRSAPTERKLTLLYCEFCAGVFAFPRVQAPELRATH